MEFGQTQRLTALPSPALTNASHLFTARLHETAEFRSLLPSRRSRSEIWRLARICVSKAATICWPRGPLTGQARAWNESNGGARNDFRAHRSYRMYPAREPRDEPDGLSCIDDGKGPEWPSSLTFTFTPSSRCSTAWGGSTITSLAPKH